MKKYVFKPYNPLFPKLFEEEKTRITPDRLFFKQVPMYHIHVMAPASKDWQEMLYFRDYLRNHPLEAQKYADLKQRAAAEVNEDGVKYRELKDPFFKRVLNEKN